MRQDPSGDLIFVDSQGTHRLRIRQPFAVDSAGQRRRVDMRWVGNNRLTLQLDPTGLIYPILMDPFIENRSRR